VRLGGQRCFKAKRVRFSAKDRFAETKELITGYWLWKDDRRLAAH
jgi:hypothetical protein